MDADAGASDSKRDGKPANKVLSIIVAIGLIGVGFGIGVMAAPALTPAKGADIQMVDSSMSNRSGFIDVNIKLTNLGDSIGAVKINVSVTQHLVFGSAMYWKSHGRVVDVKLAPGETVTSTISFDVSSWDDYRYYWSEGQHQYMSTSGWQTSSADMKITIEK